MHLAKVKDKNGSKDIQFGGINIHSCLSKISDHLFDNDFFKKYENIPNKKAQIWPVK